MSGCMCNCCPLIEVALQHHVPLGLYYYPLSAKGPTNSKRDHLLPSIGHRHTRSGRHLHHQAPKHSVKTQPTLVGGSISTHNTYAPTTLNSSISTTSIAPFRTHRNLHCLAATHTLVTPTAFYTYPIRNQPSRHGKHQSLTYNFTPPYNHTFFHLHLHHTTTSSPHRTRNHHSGTTSIQLTTTIITSQSP